MSAILVSPGQLRAVAERVRRSSRDLRHLRGQLQSAVRSLDLEMRGLSLIDERARDSIRAADTLADSAESMASFLMLAAQLFEEADRRGAGAVEANLAPVIREVRQLQQRFDLWGLLRGRAYDTAQTVFDLGLLMIPGANPAGNPLGITGPDLAERVLPGWKASSPPPQELGQGILALAAVMAASGSKVWYSTPSGVDGLSWGHVETKGGTGHSASAVHYQRDLYKDNVRMTADVGKIDVKTSFLNSGVRVTGMEATIEAEHGNDNLKVMGGATGRLATAVAEYDLDLRKGRFETTAYASWAEGEVSGGVSIFGLDVKLGLQGCAGCAGVELKGGAEGEIMLALLGGVGVSWDLGPSKKRKP